jgi:hypothetical protein
VGDNQIMLRNQQVNIIDPDDVLIVGVDHLLIENVLTQRQFGLVIKGTGEDELFAGDLQRHTALGECGHVGPGDRGPGGLKDPASDDDRLGAGVLSDGLDQNIKKNADGLSPGIHDAPAVDLGEENEHRVG